MSLWESQFISVTIIIYYFTKPSNQIKPFTLISRCPFVGWLECDGAGEEVPETERMRPTCWQRIGHYPTGWTTKEVINGFSSKKDVSIHDKNPRTFELLLQKQNWVPRHDFLSNKEKKSKNLLIYCSFDCSSGSLVLHGTYLFFGFSIEQNTQMSSLA